MSSMQSEEGRKVLVIQEQERLGWVRQNPSLLSSPDLPRAFSRPPSIISLPKIVFRPPLRQKRLTLALYEKPESGRIAVKVINHLGDEVMKVFRVK